MKKFWICVFKKQNILVFFPVLAILASLMIATPVFAEFRYAYSIVVTVPLFIAIACDGDGSRKIERNNVTK